jgi:UDP-N-acetylglucosamine 2-epimerase (non-hydrolysing)
VTDEQRVLLIFGTRPEAIKLLPVYRVLAREADVVVRACTTGQQRSMLDQVLDVLGFPVDFDLDLMEPRAGLPELLSRLLEPLETVLETERPTWVLVAGDSMTTLAGALAAFYARVRVAHVDAGLRSGDLRNPFPEEAIRGALARLADRHFAPTEGARRNLLRENVPDHHVFVTGSPGIDALRLALETPGGLDDPDLEGVQWDRPVVLVTAHRRELYSGGMLRICAALRELAARRPDLEILYPLHLNPRAHLPVRTHLGGVERVHLCSPLPYPVFVRVMQRAALVLTDSGGVQEEAVALGKTTLVLRDRIDRPEGVEAGLLRPVGTAPEAIVAATLEALGASTPPRPSNAFGDGKSAERICRLLRESPV